MPDTDRYLKLLINLDRMIKEESAFDQLKFALKKHIPAGKLEQMESPLKVFTFLEQDCLLGPDKLDILRTCLEMIGRPNLIEMLEEYDPSTTIYEGDGYKASIRNADVESFSLLRRVILTTREVICRSRNPELTLVNKNNHRCKVEVLLDQFSPLHPTGTIQLELLPKQTKTIQLPVQEIPFPLLEPSLPYNAVEVKFIPERADMKINCVTSHSGFQATQVLSCSKDVTDIEFLQMVAQVFGESTVRVMINKCKPLSNSGAKLVDYGICDGSRVDVILGETGVTKREGLGFRLKKNASSNTNFKWMAGAPTWENKSNERFWEEHNLLRDSAGNGFGFGVKKKGSSNTKFKRKAGAPNLEDKSNAPLWEEHNFLRDSTGNGFGFGMKKNGSSNTNFKWMAGAPNVENKSNEQFRDADGFPTDSSRVTTVRFRLVIRRNEMPFTGNGYSASFKRGTRLTCGYTSQN